MLIAIKKAVATRRSSSSKQVKECLKESLFFALSRKVEFVMPDEAGSVPGSESSKPRPKH